MDFATFVANGTTAPTGPHIDTDHMVIVYPLYPGLRPGLVETAFQAEGLIGILDLDLRSCAAGRGIH